MNMTDISEEITKDVIMEIKTCRGCYEPRLLRLDESECLTCKQRSIFTVLEKPCKKCNKVSAFL